MTLPIKMNVTFIGLLSDTSGNPNKTQASLSEGAHISNLELSRIGILLDWDIQILTQDIFWCIIGL